MDCFGICEILRCYLLQELNLEGVEGKFCNVDVQQTALCFKVLYLHVHIGLWGY